MGRIVPIAMIIVFLVACTRNPEGAERRRANPRPSPEPEPVAEVPQPSDPLPPGHPPLDEFEGGEGAAAGGTEPAAAADGARASVAGVRWEAPAPFRYRRPSSSMRAAEYIIDGGDEETVMTVFFFPGGGGGIQANVDRWVGQMQTSEDRPPEVSRTTVNGLPVTKIDVYGGYGGMQMPGAGGGGETAGGSRMLGAIVEGPQGPLFFKLVGPESTVNLAAEAFDGLIASFHASP
jgi:hypothetical protein